MSTPSLQLCNLHSRRLDIHVLQHSQQYYSLGNIHILFFTIYEG